VDHAQREAALAKRQRLHRDLAKRTVRGQPLMAARAKQLLDKVQKLVK
jgi:hypothetical protein